MAEKIQFAQSAKTLKVEIKEVQQSIQKQKQEQEPRQESVNFLIQYQMILLISAIHCKKLFLAGGGLAQDNLEVLRQMVAAAGRQPTPNMCQSDWQSTKCPRMAVVTSASATFQDGNQAYQPSNSSQFSYKRMFQSVGFSCKHVTAHIDNYLVHTDLSKAEGKNNFQIISNAQFIFFNGGDQSRHVRTWAQDNGSPNSLLQLMINNFKANRTIIGGTSAGLAAASKITFGQGSSFGHLYFSQFGLAPKYVKDGGVNGSGLLDTRDGTKSLLYSDNGGKMSGLQLIDIAVDSHFDARSRLLRLVPDMYDMKFKFGAGVDQATCLIVQNDELYRAVGKNGVFLVDLAKAAKSTSKYFQVSNVILHYLSSGDAFSAKLNKILTNKSQIKVPKYNSSISSNSLTDPYQITRLVTGLLDQVPTLNYGIAKAPYNFPKNAPSFRLQFIKSNQTTAYKGSNMLSGSNIILNVKQYGSQAE